MDFVNDIKDACDSIEERIYSLNNVLREKDANEEVILELNTILSLVQGIKANVNEENAYNVRSELINIQKEIDLLFDGATKAK